MEYKLTDKDIEELQLQVERYKKPYTPSLSASQKEFLEEYYLNISPKERERWVRKLFPDYKATMKSFHNLVYVWNKKGILKVKGM